MYMSDKELGAGCCLIRCPLLFEIVALVWIQCYKVEFLNFILCMLPSNFHFPTYFRTFFVIFSLGHILHILVNHFDFNGNFNGKIAQICNRIHSHRILILMGISIGKWQNQFYAIEYILIEYILIYEKNHKHLVNTPELHFYSSFQGTWSNSTAQYYISLLSGI